MKKLIFALCIALALPVAGQMVVSELITIPGNPSVDAFGGQRISTPAAIFQSQQGLNNDPHRMEDVEVSGGTATYDSAKALTRLQVTAASGDKAVRQSRWRMPYQPGRSLRSQITFAMSAAAANNEKRVGVFSDDNGVFLEQTNAGVYVCVRSSTSGSPVDTCVEQASWNLDVLDGSGGASNPSGVTLDLTKSHLLWIDYGWQGVASVRFGFILNGAIVYVHRFDHTNDLSVPWSSIGSNYVRYEIENVGASSGTPYIDAICAAVFAEGGDDPLGIVHGVSTVNNSATFRTVADAAEVPLISIRLDGDAADLKAAFRPVGVSVITDSGANYLLEVVRDGTVNGGAWANYEEIMEVNYTGTTITNGEVVWSSVIATANQGAKDLNITFDDAMYYGSLYAGTASQMSVVVTSIGASENYHASINWMEFY